VKLAEKLNPHTTALIVVDIQNDFCAPDGVLARMGKDISEMDALVDRLENLIAAAAECNVPTLYTQLVTCDIATDGYKFYRLAPPADRIFVKYNYNAFSNPVFTRTLQDNHVKTLIITGVSTQYCVETAVRNGFDLGYKIVVPEDLVATTSRDPTTQRRTLELIGKAYGVVVDSADILRIWC